jgi:DNA adenine methylase
MARAIYQEAREGCAEHGPPVEPRPDLRAPFPYYGGKSWVAQEVWQRFGDVPNYVEPFAGSAAMLLARPHRPRTETINDADGYVANFWRAVQHDSEQVAYWADWPVNENDLHARHIWLLNRSDDLQSRLEGDPDFYDAKVAGWWVWGMSCWIGSGFCSGEGPWQSVDGQLVHLGDKGKGVNRQLVHLGKNLYAWFETLAERLRYVRVCSGDWSRVLGPSVTFTHGLTAIFLDPPYAQSERDSDIYRVETEVSAAVRLWAIENGDNPLLRIALCGYEGEHEMPSSWECFEWKTRGGYGSQGDGRGKANRLRERIWFSPHALRSEQQGMLL